MNISHLLIYIKGIKDTEKKLCENDAKGEQNPIRNGTEINLHLVSLHLHLNEVELGSLQPLGWRSL